jgi:DNA helicase-2/ATP-dependent DNA helicase PcrA
MSTDFKSLYDSLNLEQQMAVDTIEGPVMVIAGPGTGKTQILAVRILNILKQTDAKPQEILCLTYTDAGSSAMLERLSRFMGADAYKVNIHTFHGLCNTIIKENPELFSKGNLRVMDDLDKLELMESLIRSIPPSSPLQGFQEQPSYLRKSLEKIFNLMQSENLDVDFFEKGIDKLSNEEAFREAFPGLIYQRKQGTSVKGDLKRKDYEKYLKEWQKLREAAALFPRYQEMKKEAGLYEFSDMLQWVLNAFKTHPDLLITYQEKYQYVLVDEYQDTSGIQNELLYQLISFWEDNPNCFVVGDDDQSIYAFQGARVSNMMDFARKYETNITKIVLTQNYRSTQIVLDGAKTLIENNRKRLVNSFPELSKDLAASGANRHYAAIPISYNAYKNRFHEALAISGQIAELRDAGCPPDEIAVIYPKHRIVDELTDILMQKEIPFTLARSVDILHEPLIIQLQNWLQYLAWELEHPHKGEYLLYTLLHYPLYDIAPFEIAKIATEIYAKRHEKVKWRDFLNDYVKQNPEPLPTGTQSREALRALWNNVEDWLKKAAGMTVPQLIQEVISQGGFLKLAMQSEQREWQMEQLHTFLSHATAANQKNPYLTLPEYIEALEKMKRNEIALRLEKRIGSKSGVVLTTAHSSKGLEYRHVFIIGCEEESWDKDKNSDLPYKIKPFFQGLKHAVKDQDEEAADKEERRRLFYVAMTRAKETLRLSWGNEKISAKTTIIKKSKFLQELIGKAEIAETELDKEDLITAETQLLARVATPLLKIEDSEWLHQQLQEFTFSPSTLYDILECGLRFYFGRLVRVPSAPSAALGYGSAVHNTLWKTVDLGFTKQQWLNESDFLNLFETELFKQRGAFTPAGFQLKMDQGKERLPQYYRSRIDIWQSHKDIILEKWLESSIDGIKIGGKADKIIIEDGNVTIVDYKTGKPKYAEASFKPPTAESLDKGKLPPKYWFQLGMYMLIVNYYTEKQWNGIAAKIDSVEQNDDKEFPTFTQYYTQEDLALLKDFLIMGNQKLRSMEFLKGCGSEDCEWCRFAKTSGQAILPESLTDTED